MSLARVFTRQIDAVMRRESERSIVGLLRSPPTPDLNPGADCEIVMCGVRGSREPYNGCFGGMGATVCGVIDRAVALLSSGHSVLTISRCGVPYPAKTLSYFWSVRVGAFTLTRLIADAVERCTYRRFVLVGVSQGAEVIRRALANPTNDIASRVIAAVLLGDPTRHPSDPWQHGTDDSHPGIASRRAVHVPATLHNRMWGYTLDGDQVAANHTGLLGLLRSGTHTLYEDNQEEVQDGAAAFIAGQVNRAI